MDWINGIYSNLSLPTRPVIPQLEELSKTKIQFRLDESDIVYHVDPVGWDRFVLKYSPDFLYTSLSPIDLNDQQTLVVPGQVSVQPGYEVVFNVGGTDKLYEVISKSYTYLYGTNTIAETVVVFSNPNHDNITTTSFKYTYQEDKNCASDNFLNYGSEKFLDIFVTAGSDPHYQVGTGCGPSGSYLNVSNLLNNGDYATAQLIAHEIGHCLGLSHADSPNSNCQFEDLPATDHFCFCSCDATTTSNNIMGYNTCRNYFSPHQIGTMRQSISSDYGGLLQRSVNCTENEHITLNITNDLTWVNSIATRGDLVVKNNSTLTVKCRVNLPPNAKIVVEPGSKLILDGGVLTNQCGYFWAGIDVQGNKNQPQTSIYQGVIEMKNNAKIEYARNGIRTIGTDENDNKDWSKTGGIVKVSNSTFLNCRRGIEFLSYHSYKYGNEVSNVSSIYNTHFTIDQELPDGVIPYAGITMFSTNGIQIRKCVFENVRLDLPTVPVSERSSGIYSIDANYEVIPVQLVYNGSYVSGSENNFNNLYYGIMTSGGTTRSDVTIRKNNFNNCAFGVGLNGSNYGKILENTFRIKGQDPASNLHFGIGGYTNSAYGFNIEKNKFYSYVVNGTENQSINIKDASALVASGSVYGNMVNNTTYGTQTIGDNSGLKIDCNGYNKGPVSNIDIHDFSGTLSNQGSCLSFPGNVPVKNTFNGSCNSTGLAEIYREPQANNFYYNAQGGSLQNGCNNLGIYATSCNGGNNTCPAGPDVSGTPPIQIINSYKSSLTQVKVEISLEKAILAAGDAQSLIDAIANQPEGVLKNTLMDASPYLSDRVIKSYLTKATTPPPGHIKDIIIANSPVTETIKTELDNMNLPRGIQIQIADAQVGISARKELENSIQYLDRERLLLIDGVVRTYLDTNWLDSTISFLKEEGSLEAICALIPHEVKKDTVSAKNHMDQVRYAASQIEIAHPNSTEPDELRGFCNFHQTLMQVKKRPGEYYSLNSKELLILQEIATAGLFVSPNAQAVLDFINEKIPMYEGYDAYFPHSMTKVEAEQMVTISGDNIYNFTVFPNPTNGNVSFKLEADNLDGLNIVITDMQGKIIKILTVSNLRTEFSFLQIENGFYLAHLLKDGQIQKTLKIVYAQ